MIRNPLTLITKASMCLHPVSGIKVLRKWMTAVGVCEGKLARGVPVLSAFARAFRRNGIRCSRRLKRLVERDSSRLAIREVPDVVDTQTRLSFMAAWGIHPEHQFLLEQYYDSWTMGKDFGGVLQGWEAKDKFPLPVAPVTNLLCPFN